MNNQQHKAMFEVILAFSLASILIQGSQSMVLAEGLCKSGSFMCMDGECIDATLRCDGKEDCQDETDEYNCFDGMSITEVPAACSEESFHCKANSEQCVEQDKRCDGSQDCTDGSDELECTGKCEGPDQFLCSDGMCIKASLVCNSQNDCVDESDENNCTLIEATTTDPDSCTKDEHRCPDGTCMSKYRLCDGLKDCHDGSDEDIRCSSTQSSSEVTTPTELENVTATAASHPKYRKGNCTEKEYTCVDSTCIPNDLVCDKSNDCPDGSDELQGCTMPHQCWDAFRCNFEQCIPWDWLCDGNADCANGRDEMYCNQRTRRVPNNPDEEAAERLEDLKQQRRRFLNINNLKVAELELKHVVIKEELAAVQKAAVVADNLAKEHLETAKLEKEAARENLQLQKELRLLKLEALRPEQSSETNAAP